MEQKSISLHLRLEEENKWLTQHLNPSPSSTQSAEITGPTNLFNRQVSHPSPQFSSASQRHGQSENIQKDHNQPISAWESSAPRATGLPRRLAPGGPPGPAEISAAPTPRWTDAGAALKASFADGCFPEYDPQNVRTVPDGSRSEKEQHSTTGWMKTPVTLAREEHLHLGRLRPLRFCCFCHSDTNTEHSHLRCYQAPWSSHFYLNTGLCLQTLPGSRNRYIQIPQWGLFNPATAQQPDICWHFWNRSEDTWEQVKNLSTSLRINIS